MPLLWFDLMNSVFDDPDWSNLPGTDKSGAGGGLDDDICKSWDDEELKLQDKYERALGIGQDSKRQKKFAWLLPPEQSR